jgi:hypothetical protein
VNASLERPQGGWGGAIGRGAGLFAGLGGVLAGFAATLDWPIVGTFFGVLEGAAAGGGFGVVVAAVVTSLGRVTPKRSALWATRLTSAAAAGAVALLASAAYTGPIDVPGPVAPALIGVAAIVGGMFGPLIAFGARRVPGMVQVPGWEPAPGWEPVPGGRVATDLGRQAGRFLAWGAAVGAGVGGAAGVVIGIRTYLPTAAFAAVEGSIFGVVSGLMFACLAAGVWLLTRVRARR